MCKRVFHQILFFCKKKTANALVSTLQSLVLLINDLIQEDCIYVVTTRLQADPIKNWDSQCHQMREGRFLLSLQEVQVSKRNLICRSFNEAGIHFWRKGNLKIKNEGEKLKDFMDKIVERESELIGVLLENYTEKVSHTISGYVA